MSGELLEAATSGECASPLHLCFRSGDCLQLITISKNYNHNFRSGDPRVNENPGLTLYHTIWHREHNRSVTHIYSAAVQ